MSTLSKIGIAHLTLPKERFAIAFSGGGDSTVLVHLLRDLNPLILIVDHGLRDGSKVEALSAKAFAEKLGLETEILSWQSGAISTGLQAKARHARYNLLGQACRKHSISDLLTAHTQDDQAETVLMRMEAGTAWRGAAAMEVISNAPLWPALAGLRLWRPLLGFSRQDLRDYLKKHHLNFIDDPSNENRAFTRIRARDTLKKNMKLRTDMLSLAKEMRQGLLDEKAHFQAIIKDKVNVDVIGGINITAPIPKHLLKLCLLCASGQGKPIDLQKLKGLHERISYDSDFVATLSGAQVTANHKRLRIIRDPGAVKSRSGLPLIAQSVDILTGQTVLWDGRWWVKALKESYKITPLAGHMSALPKVLKNKALSYDAASRPTLPLIWKRSEPICIADSDNDVKFDVKNTVLKHLHAMVL